MHYITNPFINANFYLTAETFDTEGFKFNVTNLLLALVSASLTLPVSLIFSILFRKSLPINLKRDSHRNISLDAGQNAVDYIYSDFEKERKLSLARRLLIFILPIDPLCEVSQSIEERLVSPKKTKLQNVKNRDNSQRVSSISLYTSKKTSIIGNNFIMPIYCRYVGWILCICLSTACTVITILHGLSFGRLKSYEWIMSSFFIIFMSVVIIEPLKITMLTIITTFIFKTEPVDMDMERGYPLQPLYEESYGLNANDAEIRWRKEYTPIPLEHITPLREREKARIYLQDMTIDLLIYVIYAIILAWLISESRSEWGFPSTNHVVDMYVQGAHFENGLDSITDKVSLISYLRETFLPTIHQTKFYNGSVIKGVGWSADYNTQVLGVARLRQHRIKPNITCLVYDRFDGQLTCLPEYSSTTKDKSDYGIKWNTIDGDIRSKLYSERAKQPWKYHTELETTSLPIRGDFFHYSGGGYLANFGRTQNNSQLVLDFLERHDWIDHLSRFIAIEFTLYNANVRLFNVVTLIVELSPDGFARTSYSIMTVSLLFTLDRAQVNLLLAFVFFVVMLSFFVYQQMQSIMHFSIKQHFTEMWNIFDLTIALLAFSCVGIFFARNEYVYQLLETLENAAYNEFVGFYKACYVDIVLTYFMSLLVCLTCVRIWRLLRFAVYFQLFETTFFLASLPLVTQIFVFFVILAAFSSFGFVAFGGDIYAFRAPMSSLLALISLTIGYDSDLDVDRLFQVHPEFGRLFYTVFGLITLIYLINVFLTVLMEYYADAKEIMKKKKQSYNILDYLMDEFYYYYNYYFKRNRASYRMKSGRLRGGADCNIEKLMRKKIRLERTETVLQMGFMQDTRHKSSENSIMHSDGDMNLKYFEPKKKITTNDKLHNLFLNYIKDTNYISRSVGKEAEFSISEVFHITETHKRRRNLGIQLLQFKLQRIFRHSKYKKQVKERHKKCIQTSDLTTHLMTLHTIIDKLLYLVTLKTHKRNMKSNEENKIKLL